MITQRLTVSATLGNLRVVAVWKCLKGSDAKVCSWKAQVDTRRGIESLSVDLVDASAAGVESMAMALNGSPFAMATTVTTIPAISRAIRLYGVALIRHQGSDSVRRKQATGILGPARGNGISADAAMLQTRRR